MNLTDAESPKETGLRMPLMKEKQHFKAKHSTNGASTVNLLYTLDSNFHFTYFDTKTTERIPRRFVDPSNKKAEDFIMNTYSTEPIADSVFALPSYCT